MTNLAVHHSNGSNDWQTPDEVLDIVRQVGPIGLDPCTVDDNPTRAEVWITPTSPLGCGLTHSRPWVQLACGGLVFMNPPYGRECAAWVDKAIDEASKGARIITLTAARPDTKWGQKLLLNADVLCWWRGRIKFRGAPHAAPFPSLFAAFNCGEEFARAFAEHGELTRRVASMEQAALPGVA